MTTTLVVLLALALVQPARALQQVATQMHVRDMRVADLKQVTDLRTVVFADHLTSPYSRYLQGQKWEEAMAGKTAVLVACAEGEFASSFAETQRVESTLRKMPGEGGLKSEPIVGSADIIMEPGSRCCYVTNVCVHPEARRRGVARELMSAIDVRAAELEASSLTLHVELQNTAAVKLYEGLGFAVNSDTAVQAAFSTAQFVPDDPDAPPQQLMIKPLAAHAAAHAAAPRAASEEAEERDRQTWERLEAHLNEQQRLRAAVAEARKAVTSASALADEASLMAAKAAWLANIDMPAWANRVLDAPARNYDV